MLQVAKISGVISDGLESGRLVARDSGQGSPCLDLARLNNEVKDNPLCDPFLAPSGAQEVYFKYF